MPVADELQILVYDLYPELRRIASHMMRGERAHHTLSRTALVHEAFLRLVRSPFRDLSRQDFLALAAHEMRRLLIDYARKHRALRRGGEFVRVSFDAIDRLTARDEDELLGLDQALDRLSRGEPRAASVVELKFFAGFKTEEIADILHVSHATVEADWKYAKAWLLRELSRISGDGPRLKG
ncbi:MAG TPA: ECF-type sigma factor [Bryobacteraceae bacterium]|jgi:RNA polymerase sigma factor (TIGR02999 family)|nr:ECF-type sigma factor [Bryobacteraceae bacterium]